MTQHIHMFIGKGGVGKSTSSALTALYAATSGRKTLLVSMDPAHNQCDIFERRLSEKPEKVAENLEVMEVNDKAWEEKYLKETFRHLQETYSYQSAFGLGNYFKVLKYSPGVEEYALTLAFSHILERYADRDILVFDMPPTAQSLRFLSLPSITRIWLEELLKLRRAILKKKEIISAIKVGKKEMEQDRIASRLGKMGEQYCKLGDLFEGASMHMNVVMNPDKLAFSESLRIREKLAEIGIAPARVFLNKIRPEDDIDHVLKAFEGVPIQRLPMADYQVTGVDNLLAYMKDQPDLGGVFSG
ncbi:ArsA family ATPase [Desulfoplanes sp.]